MEPGDITSLADLEKVPTFSKSDLMESVESYPPFGDYHGLDDAFPHAVLHTTSGTTGTPQPLFFGPWDREVQNALLARAYILQGMGRGDVAHSVYGYGMVNGGHYVREAVSHFTDALYVPAGTGRDTPTIQQVEAMQRYGATAILGFADYIKRLAEATVEAGLTPGKDIPMRIVSGHIGQEDKDAISQAWGGAKVYDWYGVGDTGIIAGEGPAQNGLYIWEDAHILEILDAETGAVLADGHAGNMCATPLFKTGVYPIVRFDTKDVSTVMPPDLASGIGFKRIPGFQGRSDNMVKLRGINVYPTAIGTMLDPHPATTGEYICRLTRVGTRDQLTVVVEAREVGAALQSDLQALLKRGLGVEVQVEVVAPGATASETQVESRQKPIRLLDLRPS
jgi:phenylacetate-CoA ligase